MIKNTYVEIFERKKQAASIMVVGVFQTMNSTFSYFFLKKATRAAYF